mmetsp:Transcript_592/g.1488  ORF Transcript_592/g.1488 Transcript_592/m.1488 type:complete len:195 (+) Transcript_592:2-586(+)
MVRKSPSNSAQDHYSVLVRYHPPFKMAALRTSRTLTLDAADEIASGAVAACKRQGFKPVSVVVLNSSGNTIVSKTMDGVLPAFPEIAIAKATTCTSMGMSSRLFREKYTSGEVAKFVQGLIMADIAGGALFPGGVVLRDAESGEVVGAVGVSGAAGDEDEFCALAGVEAAKGIIAGAFTMDPATHSCATLSVDQ